MPLRMRGGWPFTVRGDVRLSGASQLAVDGQRLYGAVHQHSAPGSAEVGRWVAPSFCCRFAKARIVAGSRTIAIFGLLDARREETLHRRQPAQYLARELRKNRCIRERERMIHSPKRTSKRVLWSTKQVGVRCRPAKDVRQRCDERFLPTPWAGQSALIVVTGTHFPSFT
jgi:hypothetical protein